METVLLYLLGIVIVVVGLAVSIGLHEVGHLVPAKRFGVKVGQYMIGFGPTLWSRKVGETQYGIKAIPLGGYISMAGMYPPAKSGAKARSSNTGIFSTLVQDARDGNAVDAADEDRVFYKLAPWKRIIIMLGGPTMNLLIAIVLYAILLCGFGIPQATSTLASVSQCVGTSTSQTACGVSDPVAPAADAGLKPGDRVVSVGGVAITSGDQLTAIIRKSAGKDLAVVIVRDGSRQNLTLTPLLTERPVTNALGVPVTDASGKTETAKVGFVGVGFTFATVQQPASAVLPYAWDKVSSVGGVIVTLPQRLFQVGQAAFGGAARDPNGPVSIVGVGRLAGEITSTQAPIVDQVTNLLGLLAGLNIALFVFNLIPLMPLDGGHVAAALWESLRRRFARWFKRPDPGPVDIAKLVPLTLAIVAILGVSSALLIYADIVNPVSIG